MSCACHDVYHPCVQRMSNMCHISKVAYHECEIIE